MGSRPIRVGVICDFLEEGWHSMDLIADMLIDRLPSIAGTRLTATRLRPPMVRRWSRLPVVGDSARAWLGDRLTGRLWDYPRWLSQRVREFDVFHIVDHSYAHLVRVLPANRTVITCNDVDAIYAALPGVATPLNPSRLLASRVLDGISRAGRVACISAATRRELLATGRVSSEKVNVVHLGVHPSCSPLPDPKWDAEAAALMGPPRLDVLHVGSTIPRKRIEFLLHVMAELRARVPGIRLVRVGGALTETQRALAASVMSADDILELPFLDRPLLAAVYRRASIAALPSEREGFGLPVVEAMACGTPVVASAIPALQEVGGASATYCAPADKGEWVETMTGLLDECRKHPDRWKERQRAAASSASRFDWNVYSSEMASLYSRIFVS